MTKEFLEYIEKENLIIYIFDSLNSIDLEVDDPNEARMFYTNQVASRDLIGSCKIPLRGLLANDLIQGDFPLFNLKNEKVGNLVINIIWEEIVIGSSTGMIRYDEIYEDQLIIKLADALKLKGLNIESAFNIFDIDKKKEISIENFKNTLIFTLKFTTNQHEVEYLVKTLFTSKGKIKLDKNDFYKIFSKLLPSEGQSYATNFNINNEIDNTMKNKDNTEVQPPKEKEIINNQENEIRTSAINQSSNNNTNINNINEEDKKERSISEIGQLIYKYKLTKKNYDAVDLFKDIFDKDASLGIDKRELYKGCAKMGIHLTDNETDRLWKKISGNKGVIDFSSFKNFYENYCKEEKKEDNIF
jgi:Ca2+-binding EF-hand superfamily protein